ncbi:hypothetical protein [Colwellia sp. 12G3]|uniref:hypothetical protein n=1 Tax=Colwellia sp. 12G3 TaxID=2058299 RepID=UPI000C33B382|nr:hypothetical protein [Colwellia sp. 12G3]PKI12765.1 hypothetical protein CXF71_18700 [Colwellia sp. 12G3]
MIEFKIKAVLGLFGYRVISIKETVLESNDFYSTGAKYIQDDMNDNGDNEWLQYIPDSSIGYEDAGGVYEFTGTVEYTKLDMIVHNSKRIKLSNL